MSTIVLKILLIQFLRFAKNFNIFDFYHILRQYPYIQAYDINCAQNQVDPGKVLNTEDQNRTADCERKDIT